jgi:CRP-like cAMP-binding protein
MLDVEIFKKVPFFENFSQELIDVVNTVSRLEKIDIDSYILEQGSLNFDLFFLIKGNVSVLVDEVEILQIKSSGQVFGEMSIVSHDTCRASVKTTSECYVIKVPINDLNALPEKYKDSILKDVYRSCAEILAKKLSDTNGIARSYKSLLD